MASPEQGQYLIPDQVTLFEGPGPGERTLVIPEAPRISDERQALWQTACVLQVPFEYMETAETRRAFLGQLAAAFGAGVLIYGGEQFLVGGLDVKEGEIGRAEGLLADDVLAGVEGPIYQKALELESGALEIATSAPVKTVVGALEFASGLGETVFGDFNQAITKVKELGQKAQTIIPQVSEKVFWFDNALEKILDLIAQAEEKAAGLRQVAAQVPVLGEFAKKWDDLTGSGIETLKKATDAVNGLENALLGKAQAGILTTANGALVAAFTPVEGISGFLAGTSGRAKTACEKLSGALKKAEEAKKEASKIVNKVSQTSGQEEAVLAGAGLTQVAKSKYQGVDPRGNPAAAEAVYIPKNITNQQAAEQAGLATCSRRNFLKLSGAAVVGALAGAGIEITGIGKVEIQPGRIKIGDKEISLKDTEKINERDAYRAAFHLVFNAASGIITEAGPAALDVYKYVFQSAQDFAGKVDSAISQAKYLTTHTENQIRPINENLNVVDSIFRGIVQFINNAQEAAGKPVTLGPLKISGDDLHQAAEKFPVIKDFVAKWDEIVKTVKTAAQEAAGKVDELEAALTQTESGILNKILGGLSAAVLKPWELASTALKNTCSGAESNLANLEKALAEAQQKHDAAEIKLNEELTKVKAEQEKINQKPTK